MKTPFSTYQAIDAVNWSSLKWMQVSPLHFQHYVERGRGDTTSLLMGRALHSATFEPDAFPLEYAVYDGAIRRGKAWEAFKDANIGRSILRVDEYERTLAKRDAIRRHPLVAPLLEYGEAEKTVQWTDAETGLACKARLDWVCASIVDLKGSPTVDERRFGAAAARYGYHCQLAWYRLGYQAVTGEGKPCLLVVVEHDPPHDVAVFDVGPDELYAGEEECRSLLRRLAECKASGRWPGRYEETRSLSLPAWVWGDDEDGLFEDGIKLGGNSGGDAAEEE